jgi:universal stress protein A
VKGRPYRDLVATDFSFCSLIALEHAEELARGFAAELLLLHTADVSTGVAELPDRPRAAAEDELARTIQYLRDHGLEARSLLREGPAVETVLEAAASERVSLIVMGTHGRTGMTHVLMGSVAEHVVRSAPCPVLTVRCRQKG